MVKEIRKLVRAVTAKEIERGKRRKVIQEQYGSYVRALV
jgi:hypothetical protein